MGKKRKEDKAPALARFLCETAITSPELEYSRQFGRGAIADLSEEIWPGRFLADEVRPGTYELIDAAADPAPELELQVDDSNSEE